jgi:thymidylate kinase
MIVALEGLPGAGKTTLIERLVREHGYAAVPEVLVEYIEPENGPVTFEFEKHFLKNDELKCRRAKDLNESKNVVMDKNYISTLAFNYAVTECHRGNTYDEVYRWYVQNQDILIKPDLYILLSIPIDLCFSRKDRMPDATGFWNSEDFLAKMKEFFDSKFMNIDSTVPKYKMNAEKPQDEIMNEILLILSKAG